MSEFDESRGCLSFGVRAWMPGINIHGRSYSIDYEDMTEEHRKGIPVRIDRELVGHARIESNGKAEITLLPGKTLPVLDAGPLSITTVGMAHSCESAMMEFIDTGFRKIIDFETAKNDLR